MTEASSHAPPVRLGYVGCGFIAQHIHLPNFAALSGCDLLALAELRPKLGASVAEHYRIPRLYRSHKELAEDNDIEAVAVSADYVVQGDIAADLLLAGKSVFMEKPMAVSVRQAERILAAEKRGGGRLMIAYMKRYDPANLLLRETVRNWRRAGDHGALLYVRNHGFCGNWVAGSIRSAILSSDEKPPAPPADRQSPDWLPAADVDKYIAYLQQYTHNINLARFVLDVPADRLTVRVVDLDEDGLTGIVLLDADGTRVAIESAQTDYHAWDEHTQVYFEGGWIHAHSPWLYATPGQPKVEIYEAGDPPTFHYPVATPLDAWHFREEAAHFVAAVRSGEAFRSPGSDALTDVHVLEDIYRQHLGVQ